MEEVCRRAINHDCCMDLPWFRGSLPLNPGCWEQARGGAAAFMPSLRTSRGILQDVVGKKDAECSRPLV